VRHRGRLTEFFDTYTKDLKAEDLQRLFTRDTRDAYQFFARQGGADEQLLVCAIAQGDGLPRARE